MIAKLKLIVSASMLLCSQLGIAYAQSKLPVCQGSDISKWNNCIGTLLPKKSNDGKYVGEWKGGNFNGQGTMTWPDGSKYIGQWRDDEREGQGTAIWADGTKYIGQFKNNQLNGQGTLYKNDVIVSKGEFVNGIFAADNCFIQIRRKYEFTRVDKYTNLENGRTVGDLNLLVEYELGDNNQNPVFPQYGANDVSVYNGTIDVFENGRIVDRRLSKFFCISNSKNKWPKSKIVGIERE